MGGSLYVKYLCPLLYKHAAGLDTGVKYSMDVEALVKVYTKGLVSGVRSQSGNQGDGLKTEET